MLDLRIDNARIVDVYRHRVFAGWVGIQDGRFRYVEPAGDGATVAAREERDADGAYLIPGLIDAHMHIESSLVTPRRFAEAALPFGTTTVLADPHEVANVAGADGVSWMIAASQGLALRILHAIPSCVPATDATIEWTNQVFDAAVIAELAEQPGVIALGEVMDYRSVADGSGRLPAMVAAARARGLRLEGHIPTLAGSELSDYLYHGITSDHTLTTPQKLGEQIGKGVHVMLQYKSLEPETIDAVNALPERSRVILVTDDVEPSLLTRGHLSTILDRAVDAGLDPLEAIACATVRPATYLGLHHAGGIAPGNDADFLLARALPAGEAQPFCPAEVFVAGRSVARDGRYTGPAAPPLPAPPAFPAVPDGWQREHFLFGTRSGRHTARCVTLAGDRTSLTHLTEVPLAIQAGRALLQPGDALNLVSVTARDRSAHSLAVARNLGLERGAFASCFAHDSHNVLVVGRDPDRMLAAVRALQRQQGGVVLVQDDQTVVAVPLPVVSLLSDQAVPHVADQLATLETALRTCGMTHSRPFLILSLLSLTVSPYAKFSDKGVVDTEARKVLAPLVE